MQTAHAIVSCGPADRRALRRQSWRNRCPAVREAHIFARANNSLLIRSISASMSAHADQQGTVPVRIPIARSGLARAASAADRRFPGAHVRGGICRAQREIQNAVQRHVCAQALWDAVFIAPALVAVPIDQQIINCPQILLAVEEAQRKVSGRSEIARACLLLCCTQMGINRPIRLAVAKRLVRIQR